jgi:hypothetical protein
MHIARPLLSPVLLALAIGCRSSQQSVPDSTEQGKAAAVEATPPAAEPEAAEPEAEKPVVNTAEAIAALTKSLPLYPNSKSKIPTTWTAPAQFDEGKWGSTYEADTADPMEKVLDYYDKEMTARGWTGARAFKGMISFEKKSAPGKLVTLASGADDKVPGQTLLRVLVLDK